MTTDVIGLIYLRTGILSKCEQNGILCNRQENFGSCYQRIIFAVDDYEERWPVSLDGRGLDPVLSRLNSGLKSAAVFRHF